MGPDKEDGCGGAVLRRWIASELASTEACRVFMVAVKVSKVAWRAASLSPMAEARCGVGGADDERGGGGGEVYREGEEGLERDTRLSRTSSPRVAGPWLRSS